jgi:dTDP-4-dehydrorhamnose reductase
MPERFLILGSRGMVGRAWKGLCAAHGLECEAVGRHRLDLEDVASVARLDVSGFSHVVNCAAWTAVDDAEAHEDRATRINAEAVGVLARSCARAGAVFVTYSTDYVFDGEATEPYATDHPHDPVNAYGRSKAAGEKLLASIDAPWLCVRTSWVYAPWGKNFVRTIAGAARARPELRVVEDQRGRPTSAEGLARSTMGLLRAGVTGTAHATDGGECSWFEFAQEIVRLLHQRGAEAECLAAVHPCGSEEFPRPAPRPAYSVLDITRTEALIGPMTPWPHALADVLRRLDPA